MLWWALWNWADIVEGKFRRHTQRPVFALENIFSSFLTYGQVHSATGNAFSRFLLWMVEKFANRVLPMRVPKANNGEYGILAVFPLFRRKFLRPWPRCVFFYICASDVCNVFGLFRYSWAKVRKILVPKASKMAALVTWFNFSRKMTYVQGRENIINIS